VIVEKKEDEPAASVTPEEIIREPMAEIDSEFIKMVNDVYESCRSASFYEILCLNEYASEEEIKKAYFRMAKEFHPDRHFSISSEDTKNKLNKIVDHVTEAYNVLSDPHKKEEYDRSLLAETDIAGAVQSQAEQGPAEVTFNEGRSKMLLGFYDEAQQLFSEAIQNETSDPKYHYYQGLALNRLGFYKEASTSLKEAIRLDPRKTNYHTALGFTFIKLGFNQRAKSSFRKALDISPYNEKAIEGLRGIE
jgi:curved DNA-binding protein CbpA